MRTQLKNVWLYIGIIAFVLILASCNNSRKARHNQLQQPQDSAVIIEEESVVVEVDSIVPDTMTVAPRR